MKISFHSQVRKKDRKTSTEAKAKMETLFKRVYSATSEVEDVIGVQRGKGQPPEEMEVPASMYERELFQAGLGFEQIASRGYAITPKNVQAFYKLEMLDTLLVTQDPDMLHPLTRRVHLRFITAARNLKQRTISKDQTNVEVVDIEPMVKVVTVPSWGRIADTDMEKEKKEDE